jgi:hypothetical protein
MLNKELLLMATSGQNESIVRHPFSRFKVTFVRDGSLLGYSGDQNKDEYGTFQLISGDDLLEKTLLARMIQCSTEGGLPTLFTLSGTVFEVDAVAWLVNESTGETVYGIATTEMVDTVSIGEIVFGLRTRAEAEALLGTDFENADFNTYGPIFTADDAGKPFTLSIYVDGYGFESAPEPYTRYRVTVGEQVGNPFTFRGFMSVNGSENVVGSGTLLDGENISVSVTGMGASGGQTIEEICTLSVNGDSFSLITLPIVKGSAPGICTVVNETTGQTLYGTYGTNTGVYAPDTEAFVGFETKELAQNQINTGEYSSLIPMFTEDDVGKTFDIAVYVEEPLELPYSRFEIVCGQDDEGSAFGYESGGGRTFGQYTHLSGTPLTVQNADGVDVTYASSDVSFGSIVGFPFNSFTFPESENNEGIVRLVNETTGDVIYGVYGRRFMNTMNLMFVMFVSYEDASAYFNDTNYKPSTYSGNVFDSSMVGQTFTFSIYLM